MQPSDMIHITCQNEIILEAEFPGRTTAGRCGVDSGQAFQLFEAVGENRSSFFLWEQNEFFPPGNAIDSHNEFVLTLIVLRPGIFCCSKSVEDQSGFRPADV